MIHLNSSTNIYKPIKQVFEFISAPENDFLWQYGILTTARLSPAGTGVGASFRSVGHFLGQRMQSVFEVTEYEPNSRYAFKSLSNALNSQTSYTFEIKRGGTHLNMCIQANMIEPQPVNEDILEKKMRKQFKENLTLLKDVLEGM